VGTQCPLWVKSGHCAVSGRCPLYPQKRTFGGAFVMSALCQKQTFTGLTASCIATPSDAASGTCVRG
jgi:hypothetical protein